MNCVSHIGFVVPVVCLLFLPEERYLNKQIWEKWLNRKGHKVPPFQPLCVASTIVMEEIRLDLDATDCYWSVGVENEAQIPNTKHKALEVALVFSVDLTPLPFPFRATRVCQLDEALCWFSY